MFHDGTFAQIISLDNLFAAWENYRKGKRSKSDVQLFEFRLEDNIFQLHKDLAAGCYRPGNYQQFKITDPKTRLISKAPVRDRLLHQAIYQILYPAFDRTFIFDSYSCRNNKGTHKAFQRLVRFSRQVSRNYTAPCWALKMDIRKFFDSVDHEILLGLLSQRIADRQLLYVIYGIIRSFEFTPGKGMPLGNLTSQLFANVYMDPLDKFVKHRLKAKYYLRYADDFLLLANNPRELLGCFVEIQVFLREQLKLRIHPDKIALRKLSWGIDFVGYVARPYYNLPRRKTVRRIFKKAARSTPEELAKSLPSYLGYLQHAKSRKQIKKLLLLQ
ncbi:MAG: reverse transcriptase/maturase family protein [Patescibacteria group bacterium]